MANAVNNLAVEDSDDQIRTPKPPFTLNFLKGILMSIRFLVGRLFGMPMITKRYRIHWRVLMQAHPLILKLIEDNEDGETRRASLAHPQSRSSVHHPAAPHAPPLARLPR